MSAHLLALIVICVSVLNFGEANPNSRVVGGVDAIEGQFKHQISLRYGGSHICGGSIISRNYVLTAAHCISSTDDKGNVIVNEPHHYSIRAGSTHCLRDGVLNQVVQIVAHEKYGNFLNDAALLKLKDPLYFSDHIQAIPLASAEVPVGEDVIISGWGYLRTGGYTPNKLQWNTLQAISKNQCYLSIGMGSDTLLCLAHEVNNGACSGDSGGPAIYNNELVGVAGFVVDGCGSKNPDGYAKVFYHRDWIIEHAGLY